jgi:hypothetical protein
MAGQDDPVSCAGWPEPACDVSVAVLIAPATKSGSLMRDPTHSPEDLTTSNRSSTLNPTKKTDGCGVNHTLRNARTRVLGMGSAPQESIYEANRSKISHYATQRPLNRRVVLSPMALQHEEAVR